MKKIVVLTALAVLLFAGWVDAGCATFAIKRAVVVQSACVAPTHYYAPTNYGYSGYYNANYDRDQAFIKEQQTFLKLVLDHNQQLRQENQQLKQAPRPDGGAGIARPVGRPTGLRDLVAKRCAGCHQLKNADKGGGFVLLEDDGSLPPFSIAEKRAIDRAAEKGTMPLKPGPDGKLVPDPLPEEEVAVFRAEFAKK